MGTLELKDGARLDRLTPAGAAIIAALWRTAINLPYSLTVTSGTDGEHSGPADPHHFGNAIDVRSHDLPEAHKVTILQMVMGDLATVTSLMGQPSRIEAKDGGFVTGLFYGFLESPGLANEHFHFQLRNGRVFGPSPAAPVSAN